MRSGCASPEGLKSKKVLWPAPGAHAHAVGRQPQCRFFQRTQGSALPAGGRFPDRQRGSPTCDRQLSVEPGGQLVACAWPIQPCGQRHFEPVYAGAGKLPFVYAAAAGERKILVAINPAILPCGSCWTRISHNLMALWEPDAFQPRRVRRWRCSCREYGERGTGCQYKQKKARIHLKTRQVHSLE